MPQKITLSPGLKVRVRLLTSTEIRDVEIVAVHTKEVLVKGLNPITGAAIWINKDRIVLEEAQP